MLRPRRTSQALTCIPSPAGAGVARRFCSRTRRLGRHRRRACNDAPRQACSWRSTLASSFRALRARGIRPHKQLALPARCCCCCTRSSQPARAWFTPRVPLRGARQRPRSACQPPPLVRSRRLLRVLRCCCADGAGADFRRIFGGFRCLLLARRRFGSLPPTGPAAGALRASRTPQRRARRGAAKRARARRCGAPIACILKPLLLRHLTARPRRAQDGRDRRVGQGPAQARRPALLAAEEGQPRVQGGMFELLLFAPAACGNNTSLGGCRTRRLTRDAVRGTRRSATWRRRSRRRSIWCAQPPPHQTRPKTCFTLLLLLARAAAARALLPRLTCAAPVRLHARR